MDWDRMNEIVGESGEPGKGCLDRALKMAGLGLVVIVCLVLAGWVVFG